MMIVGGDMSMWFTTWGTMSGGIGPTNIGQGCSRTNLVLRAYYILSRVHSLFSALDSFSLSGHNHFS